MPKSDKEEITTLWEDDKVAESVESQPETEAPAAVPAIAQVYPEHDKLSKISDKSQIIGEFVEWLNGEKNIFLSEKIKEPGRHGRETLEYARPGIRSLLAEFFGIDQQKLSDEKTTMVNAISLQVAMDRFKKEEVASGDQPS